MDELMIIELFLMWTKTKFLFLEMDFKEYECNPQPW